VSLLLYINHYLQKKTFDVIILDCAPTGESLRFISIPKTLEWYMNKLFKMERTLVKYARPIAKKFYEVPLPGDDYFEAIEHLFERLRGVDKILTDPQITTVRLVTNPEKIVLKETQRAFMYFSLYKMHIDGIIMNRVLPEGIKDIYFEDWRKSQKKYQKMAGEYFSPIPIFPVRLFRGEVLGYESLKMLAEEIYGKQNPLDRFYKGEPYSLVKENGVYVLSLQLPFIAKDEVVLNKLYDELIIRVGGFKRYIALPRSVAALNSVTAKLEGQFLKIQFQGEKHGDKEK